MQYLHIAIRFPVCIMPPSYMLSERSRQILRTCVTNLEVNMFCVLWKRIDGDILTRAQMFYWIYHDSVAHLSSLIFFSPIAFSLYHDHLRLYAIFNTYTLMILRWNPGGIEVAYSFSKLHGTPFFPRKCFSLVVQAKLDIIMYTTDDRRWMCVSLFVVSKAIYSNIQCVVVCSPILINLY